MYLPDEKSIVGRNLQILINQKNWSIKQAAKELNISKICSFFRCTCIFII